jgi:hypothetical protein
MSRGAGMRSRPEARECCDANWIWELSMRCWRKDLPAALTGPKPVSALLKGR